MSYLLGGGGGGAAEGSKIGTSRQGTLTLIGQVRDSAKDFTSETIKTKIETGIVAPLVTNWYAEDAVLFLNSLGSIVYALTSEIAVLSNAAIGAIAGSYDSWLLSTSGQELGEGTNNEKLDTELDDIFVLTPEMRVDEIKVSLEEKMRRVLEKMSSEPIEQKKKTVSEELQPLLHEWMQRMRPDLSEDIISKELEKILLSSDK